jgi:hypothetical protein
MLRYHFFLTVVLICSIAYGQEKESLYIRQLKEKLGKSAGTHRADLMVEICKAYFEQGFFGAGDRRSDSIIAYSKQGLQFSEGIGYNKGRDEAKVFLAFGGQSKSLRSQEAYRLYHEVLKHKSAGPFYLALANSFLGAIYAESRNQPDSGRLHLRLAIEGFRKAGYISYEAFNEFGLGVQLFQANQFTESIDHLTKSLQYFRLADEKGKSNEWTKMMYIRSLHVLIQVYTKGGDIATAKQMILETEKFYRKEGIAASLEPFWIAAYTAENNRDSALYFIRMQERNIGNLPGGALETGKALAQIGMYNDALPYLTCAVDSFRTRSAKPGYPNAQRAMMEALIASSQVYYELGNSEQARKLAEEALTLIPRYRSAYSMLRQAEILASLYAAAGPLDSAVYFHKRYRQLKDSMINEEFMARLSGAKLKAQEDLSAAQIDLLRREKEIKEQQLLQEALIGKQKDNEILLLAAENSLTAEKLKTADLEKSNKEADLAIAQQENLIKEERLKDAMLLRKIFIAGSVLVILFGLALFRALTLRKKNETLQRKQAENQLGLKQMESSRKEAEYSQQVLQLEMQALRARMNPHFIFNCLSSINWLILGNQNEAASKYLHQFSRLMRMVLENSGRSFVTVEEELNMLTLYLKMEQLRFENSFEYQIDVQNDLDIRAIMVPPLLLQPFCENAIWHGLMHKETRGMLVLKIQGRDDEVIYTIEDNGIGRANAAQIQGAPDSNHRSMGTSITGERISLLNKVGGSCTIQIEDLVDLQGEPKGTRVVIKLGQVPASANEKHFES